MMTNFYNFNGAGHMMGQWLGILGWWIWPLLIWSIVWKGMALWQSARRGENVWFVILLVVNTVGILEILYLYFFSKKMKPV